MLFLAFSQCQDNHDSFAWDSKDSIKFGTAQPSIPVRNVFHCRFFFNLHARGLLIYMVFSCIFVSEILWILVVVNNEKQGPKHDKLLVCRDLSAEICIVSRRHIVSVLLNFRRLISKYERLH